VRESKNKNIAIFGGTFDPPHNAHVAIAEKALSQFNLNKIFFIPAYIPPHKPRNLSSSAKHRLKMLELAIGKNKKFAISKIELRRRGVSYTVDTLRFFRKKYPSSQIFLIIGADNLAIFGKWKSYKSIIKLANLLVYKRRGFGWALKSGVVKFSLIKGSTLNISSTKIRELVAEGKSIAGLVPKAVEKYVKSNSLYKQKCRNDD